MTDYEKSRKLARISGQVTRYELAAHHADGRKALVCYTPRNNRNGIWDAIANESRLSDVVRFCGSEKADGIKGGWKVGEWDIRFTGRTQRQAISEGELPTIYEGQEPR